MWVIEKNRMFKIDDRYSFCVRWLSLALAFFVCGCERESVRRSRSADGESFEKGGAMEGVDLRSARSVAICRLASSPTEIELFADQDAVSPKPVEVWQPVGGVVPADRDLMERLQSKLKALAEDPLPSFPAVGYADGFVFLDDEARPILSILRLNLAEYYRLSPEVEVSSEGYSIDLTERSNMTFLKCGELDEMLSILSDK